MKLISIERDIPEKAVFVKFKDIDIIIINERLNQEDKEKYKNLLLKEKSQLKS